MVLDAIPSSRTVVRFRIHYAEQLRDIFAKHTTKRSRLKLVDRLIQKFLVDSSKEKTLFTSQNQKGGNCW
jgi:hypothetical protein